MRRMPSSFGKMRLEFSKIPMLLKVTVPAVKLLSLCRIAAVATELLSCFLRRIIKVLCISNFKNQPSLNRQIKTQLRENPVMNHVGCQKVSEAVMTAMKASGYWVRKLFDSEAVQYARSYASYALLLPEPSICHTK